MSVLPTGTNIYSYVWRWWDGTVEAVETAAAAKVVNMGGHPDTQELHYSCTAVAVDGQEVTLNGTFQANNSPRIYQPTITVNDAYLPFSTRLGFYYYDIENPATPAAVTVRWFSESAFLSYGLSSGASSTSGTWTGNAVQDVRSYTSLENHYYANVFSSRTISCQLVDTNQGTTWLDFDLRGFQRPAPPTGVLATTASILTSIFSLPVQRIYTGAYFDFEVIARDASGGPLEFAWSFSGSNHWTVEAEGRGVSNDLPDGSTRSVYHKVIDAEVVSTGTQKTVVAECIIQGQSARSDVRVEVILLKNTAPPTGYVVVRNNSTGQVYSDLSAVPKEDNIQYDAIVTDPDGDILEIRWNFTLTSPGVARPTSYLVYGPKVVLTPEGVFQDGYANGGCRILGTCTIFDRLGAGPTVLSISAVTLI